MRVLICEDETIIRLDLRATFEDAGYEVIGEAKDGEEAVRLAIELEPDLVVMDVQMPKLDGIEAAKRLLTERPVPVVIVTAFPEQQLVERAVEAGVFGYVVKPFRREELLAAVHTARGPLRRAAGGARRGELAAGGAREPQGRRAGEGPPDGEGGNHRGRRVRPHPARIAAHRTTDARDRRRARRDTERRRHLMQRARLMLAATLVLTAAAGVAHYAIGDAAGAYVSAVPLVLVAPIIAIGCDSLRGRLSASMLGIVQSAFGNVAEFALTLLALRANLPDVVRIAIAGSILGNALLLGGIAGLMPTIRARGRNLTSLRFERHLFSSIATLAVVAVVPIGILSFGTGAELGGHAREDISLAAGIGLLLIGALFLLTEIRKEAPETDAGFEPLLSGREADAVPRRRRARRGADLRLVRRRLRARRARHRRSPRRSPRS